MSERKRQLHEMPMDDILARLNRAMASAAKNPHDNHAWSNLAETGEQVFQELLTNRQEQLIDRAQRVFGSSLPKYVERKRAEVALQRQRHQEQPTAEMSEKERKTLLAERLKQRVPPNLNDISLYVLATMPDQERLTGIYQSAKKLDAEQKEPRNRERAVQLTKVVEDMTSGDPAKQISGVDVVEALLGTDGLLATRAEDNTKNFVDFWKTEIPFRLRLAANHIKSNMKEGLDLTIEEQTLVLTLARAMGVSPQEDVNLAIYILEEELLGEEGILQKWIERETVELERLMPAEEVSVSEVSQEQSESTSPVILEGEYAGLTEDEAFQKLQEEEEERDAGKVVETPEVVTSEEFSARRAKREEEEMANRRIARLIVDIIKQQFPELLQGDRTFQKGLIESRFSTIIARSKIEAYVDTKMDERRGEKRKDRRESGTPLLDIYDMIAIFAQEQTDVADKKELEKTLLNEVEKAQIEYRLPRLLVTLATAMTGVKFEVPSGLSSLQIKSGSGEDIGRLMKFLESISTSTKTISMNQLEKFFASKSGTEFNQASTKELEAIVRSRPKENLMHVITYLYLLNAKMPIENRHEFERAVKEQVKILADVLSAELRAYKGMKR